MNRYRTLATSAALLTALHVSAKAPAEPVKAFPAPGEIVAAAKAEEWVAISPSDLLVMNIAPDAKGKPRRVVIQLMPPPFSQGWIGNIRKLAAAHWWDGTSINRVQDNYVVQWGDATENKELPEGLSVMKEGYLAVLPEAGTPGSVVQFSREWTDIQKHAKEKGYPELSAYRNWRTPISGRDDYAGYVTFYAGFPVAGLVYPDANFNWPVHCYGMVGVGRNLSPDTGTGAELYTVIGHAPRHLDRNIALVGRVIEGMENLSSLPRGTGALGFYETEAERVPILSVRVGNDATDVLAFEYLSTESKSFAAYADARANRRDPFFIRPAGGADICNIPVPVRRKPAK